MAYHTITWVLWLCAAAFLALANQQPLQSILLILAIGTVFHTASRRHPLGQDWGAFLRVGACVWLMTLGINLFFSHAGQVVLFSLPKNWPLVGGAITLEALLYGLANGASLFALLLVFATFNLVINHHRLLRWIPAGLFQTGLIISIALTFVPQMVSSLRDIREAQRVRGHKVRGIRGLVPLFVPLVTTGLERSLALAESMEARGFGGIVGEYSAAARRTLHLTTLLGLLAVLSGLVWRVMRSAEQWQGLVLLSLGLMSTLAALAFQSKHARRSHYRRELWRHRDTLVTLASVASLVLSAWAKARCPSAMWYYPYPPFSPWPTFTPLIGLPAMLLAAPVFPWATEAESSRRWPNQGSRDSSQ